MRYIMGVDLGGTNIVVGTVAEDGTAIYGVRSEPTRAEEGSEAVVARIARVAGESLAEAERVAGVRPEQVVGVGIGAPGPLDRERGIVLVTPNLGWSDFPLRRLVSDALGGLPATLDNDANCAVYGEWWVGAATGSKILIGITIGTGIGGGIVIDGKIFHGASDVAGEIGHTTIDSTGRRCKCGNYGCLEAYASGPAIAARAVEGVEAGAESRLPEYVGGDLAKITAQTVYQAAHDHDDFALEVVRDTAKFLGAGVANLLNIFNPDTFVILGGVTLAGDHLFVPLQAEIKRRAFKPAVDACRVLAGTLPGTAGVFGAAGTFRHQTWGTV
jgi:glucokinase